MGSYTTVVDVDGREYQFKAGDDDYERYKLGDKVDQKIYPDEAFAGKLLDGVYEGLRLITPSTEEREAWKVAVAEWTLEYGEAAKARYGASNEAFLSYLETGESPPPPDPSLPVIPPQPQHPADKVVKKWVVIKDATIMALVDFEYDGDGEIKGGNFAQSLVVGKRFGVVDVPLSSWTDAAWLAWAKEKAEDVYAARAVEIECYGMSPREVSAYLTGKYMKARMQEDGFLRRLLTPVKVPDDAPEKDAT